MDTLRFLLAIVLTIAVVVITNVLFQPTRPPADGEPVEQVEEARAPEQDAEPQPEVEAEPPAPEPEPEQAPTPELARAEGPADTLTIVSPLYRYGFSTRGAGLVRSELRQYQSFTRDGPVELVPDDGRPLVEYRLQVGDEVVDLRDIAFEVDGPEELQLEEGDSARVRFVHADPDSGFGIELVYTFYGDRYTVDVAGRVYGAGERAQLLLDMGPALASNEADTEEDRNALGYVVNSTEEGIESVGLNDLEDERIHEGPLTWAAIKNKYFLIAALRGEDDGAYYGGVIAEDLPGEFTAAVSATLPVGRDQEFGYRLYAGPQDVGRLAELAEGLDDVNPYGWAILRPLIRPLAHFFTWMLVGMQQTLGVAYGWVLILFGFLVQVVLWPLYAKAARSQIKNMEVQPLLKEIQEKYKDEPEKLQKEMMRLYKEEGFNPLGGCLPMLIPFPVLITLFFVFQNTIEFRGVDFLWLPDLSRPDPIYLLPIVLGASMFALQWLSRRSMKTDNPQMKMMMWIMPAFMVVIFFNLSSGLNLYYAASNVASVPRQVMIMNERKRAQGRVSE